MVFLNAIFVFSGLLLTLSGLLLVAEKFLINYGICQIDINAGEKQLEEEGGQTLLSALYNNEVFIPSACGGKGSCGHCKVEVAEGGGPVLPTETPYLTRHEILRGVRLACQVKVRENMSIKMPEDLLNVQLFRAQVASTRSLTHDIKEIRLALQEPEEINHRPGQYVQVQAPSPEGPVFRAYSISSPVYEKNVVELIVRLVPGGVGSTYLHQLQEGDSVLFTGPYGEFRLNEDENTEIICVGGGCGMAPMKNIIYTIYNTWPNRSCWLFFGCRTGNDVFYLDQFRQLSAEHPNFHVVYALSNPEPADQDWDGEVGFIHLAVDKYLKPGPERQAFLCGPPPMIDAVTTVLSDLRISSEDIFYDKF